MYPTALTQLARANPFSAPLFSLQKVEEPQPSVSRQSPRSFAAAATSDGNPGSELLQPAALASGWGSVEGPSYSTRVVL